MDRAKHNEEIREAHRAIGRYVVAFSEMVAELREQIARRISRDEWPLANVALGYSGAMDISHVFFWLCREVGDLTDGENLIASALSKDLEQSIRTRNEIAHGNWLVGYISVQSPVGTVPPRLIHIIPHQKKTPYKVQDLTPADIDELTDRLLALLTDIAEFGKLALDFPITELLEGGEYRTSTELHVGDVFTLHPGAQDQPAKVMRDGPRAHDVARIPFI
ncbi:MAG: hypothetical protein ABSB73_10220 [Solirubrobacteraceae bacterium]|jgi:hypothetical protein